MSHFCQKNQFFESYLENHTKKGQFCESYQRKKFNSLSYKEKTNANLWAKFRIRLNWNLFSQNVSKILTSLSYELFLTWLKELIFFFFENNSKNWLFSKKWFKESNFFLSMTQRIELTFVWIRLKESNRFFWMWLNWNLGWINSQKIDFFTQNWTFLHMTRRIELFFSIWLKESNPVVNMIQRIVFEFRLKELNLLLFDSKNWAFFVLDAMHWTFFLFAAKNSLSHIGKQERFNSLSQKKDFNSFCHLEKRFIKRGSIRWVKSYFLKKKVQFRESYKKGSILWVISEKKSWILWVVLENFNSSNRIQKKKISMLKKKVIFKKTSSILWVVLKKKTVLWVVFVLQKKFHFESHSEKKGSILRVIFFGKNILKRRFKSVSHKKSNSLSFFLVKKPSLWVMLQRRVQFFESYWKNLWVILKKKKVQFFVSYFWWKLNSLSRFFFWQKNSKIQFCDSRSRNFNSLSHSFFEKKTILRVMLKKVQFIESCSNRFNPLSLSRKKVQFFESFFLEKSSIFYGFDSLSRIQTKVSSILWVILQKEEGSILSVTFKKFNSLSYIQRRFNSLSQLKKINSNWEEVHKRGSILWVVYKEFNSFSHFSKRRFRFFESLF